MKNKEKFVFRYDDGGIDDELTLLADIYGAGAE